MFNVNCSLTTFTFFYPIIGESLGFALDSHKIPFLGRRLHVHSNPGSSVDLHVVPIVRHSGVLDDMNGYTIPKQTVSLIYPLHVRIPYELGPTFHMCLALLS